MKRNVLCLLLAVLVLILPCVGCMLKSNVQYAAGVVSWDCSGDYRPGEAHQIARDVFALWVHDITDGVNLIGVSVAGVPLFPLQAIPAASTTPTP